MVNTNSSFTSSGLFVAFVYLNHLIIVHYFLAGGFEGLADAVIGLAWCKDSFAGGFPPGLYEVVGLTLLWVTAEGDLSGRTETTCLGTGEREAYDACIGG